MATCQEWLEEERERCGCKARWTARIWTYRGGHRDVQICARCLERLRKLGAVVELQLPMRGGDDDGYQA